MPTLNSASGLAVLAATVAVVAGVLHIVYNLFFHPLRHIPGDFWDRATKLRFIYRGLGGRMPFRVLALHDRYGPVVRVAPNQVAFLAAAAWKDIYGRRHGLASGADELAKDPEFYATPGVAPSILSEARDAHAQLRKGLAPGFSERAVRAQEPVIAGYVALLLRQLRAHCGTDTARNALDMRAWFTWTTFDVIGDLALGEPFGCLEGAAYHPWVWVIAHTLRAGALFRTLNLLHVAGWVMPLVDRLVPQRQQHRQLGLERLRRRLARETAARPDFVEGLVAKKRRGLERLSSTAGLLVVAGSETTATLLTGATYLLLRHPACLARLTAEVRSTFACDKDMTLAALAGLPYLQACLNEALRRYPPVPIGLPRVAPRGGCDVAGVYVPGGTSVACWQWAMNHSAQHWEDPFAFRPERFLAGSTLQDHPEAMQPFSVGPRDCLGRNLAYAEMRLILARLLFNFDLELADPTIDWMDQDIFTLWDKPELSVYLTPRD